MSAHRRAGNELRPVRQVRQARHGDRPYCMVDEAMHREAAAKLDAWAVLPRSLSGATTSLHALGGRSTFLSFCHPQTKIGQPSTRLVQQPPCIRRLVPQESQKR